MNKNLDLTSILQGCPKGTELYHVVYGKVTFFEMDDSEYPIYVKGILNKYQYTSVTKDGKMWIDYDGECVLFPSKDQRDWSKFERFWNKPNLEKFDPKTLKPFDKVLVRDEDCCWIAGLFSHIDDSIDKVYCNCLLWKQCIPYNDETKDLVGTKKDCPEYYKWWRK